MVDEFVSEDKDVREAWPVLFSAKEDGLVEWLSVVVMIEEQK